MGSQQLYLTLNVIFHLHKHGPYGNLKDIHVYDFIGLPLLNLHTSPVLCGEDQGINTQVNVVKNTSRRTHQESRSPKLAVNKIMFNRSVCVVQLIIFMWFHRSYSLVVQIIRAGAFL